VLNQSEKAMLQPETLQKLSILRKEENTQAVIFVGAGTCGLGAGANETMRKAKEWLAENNIQADVIPVGCIGLCSSEPLLDVKLPGKKRISFEKVSGDKVSDILTQVLNQCLSTLF
jgi:hypothetical protein